MKIQRSRRWHTLLAAWLMATGCSTTEPPAEPQPPLKAVPGSASPGYLVDPSGREVLLRGVNVNSYAEYWAYDPEIPTVTQFTEADMDFLAGMGYNFVRLLVTWSRVEPEPGVYDDSYLATIRNVSEKLWQRGIYTMVDMHQDGWGPYIAARPDEVCDGKNSIPAGGWDGAPAWATLVDEATERCLTESAGHYVRELNPAAREAWLNMLDNSPGPGGVGLLDRFAAMWGHVAGSMASADGVMGYDIINEPNAIFGQDEFDGLRNLYIKALAAIRTAEDQAGIPRRLFVFEPSANWANVPSGATVEPFTDDTQIVYAPHVYQGSIGLMPLNESQLDRLHEDADSYGGAPVLVGEWGGNASKANEPGGYYERMLQLQDREHWGMAHWVYMSHCGDPHLYVEWYFDDDKFVEHGGWAYRQVLCDQPEETWPLYEGMVDVLRRPALHYAPGPIAAIQFENGVFAASGTGAVKGTRLELFVPGTWQHLHLTTTGLKKEVREPKYNGIRIVADAIGDEWSVTLQE